MNSNNRNKFVVGLLAGTAIGGLVLYYFFNRKVARKVSYSKKSLELSHVAGPHSSYLFIRDRAYLEMVGRLKPTIDSEKQVGKFSKGILIAISKIIFHLLKAEYLKNFSESRELRRKCVNNISDYASEYAKGTRRSEQIVEEATSEVLRDLHIDPTMYERECLRVSNEDANFQLYNIFMLESLKSQLPVRSFGNVSKETLTEYYNYQLSIYDEYRFSELTDHSAESFIMCKQSFLSDLAAIKFGIEEENLARNQAFMNEPEVIDLHRELQSRFFNEKQNFISFPY
jgi:hypothetical protein